ncbi:PPM family protein phosphatase [Anaerolineae bacterium]|nr:PPM family protein phosphatase [Anaerolineae bacterium]
MSGFFKWLRGHSQGINDYEIVVALASDPGCCRPNNEDSVQFFSPQGDPRSALAVVADGMGGHNAGEIASREAITAIGSRYFLQPSSSHSRILRLGFSDANARIFALAKQHPEWAGMGTTATALLIGKGMACYAHVGDSRLYRVRGGAMEQLSTDHTLVAALAKDGLIPSEGIANHPDRNVITRAIGTKPSVEVEVGESEWPIQIGDTYLLCSDGLYDMVTGQDIESILRENSLSEACDLLIQAARNNGGYDNVSAIVLAIREQRLAHSAPPPTKM